MEIKYVFLDDDITMEDIKPYLSLLPEQRQQKIARYRFDLDKLTSAVAGLLIRKMIGDRELEFNSYHKPYIKDCDDLYFSVSHSGRCVAIAVDTVEVGIDVEMIRKKDIDKLSERFFSEGEQAYFSKKENKPSAFTEIWTRKEAYLKCKGTGISEDLSAFDTTSDDLKTYLYSANIGEYFLSVCSKTELKDLTNISELELNDIL